LRRNPPTGSALFHVNVKVRILKLRLKIFFERLQGLQPICSIELQPLQFLQQATTIIIQPHQKVNLKNYLRCKQKAIDRVKQKVMATYLQHSLQLFSNNCSKHPWLTPLGIYANIHKMMRSFDRTLRVSIDSAVAIDLKRIERTKENEVLHYDIGDQGIYIRYMKSLLIEIIHQRCQESFGSIDK